MAKKLIGYINLYKYDFGDDYLHWAGSLYKTPEEASKYKDKNKARILGQVFVEEK